MTVSHSFAIGVLGMRAFSEQMQGISNNVANVGTTGYKRTETRFHDLVAPDAKPSGNTDHGVRAVKTQRIGEAGQIARTDGELDVAIAGRGFFRVTPNFDGSGVAGTTIPGHLYTRDGAFQMTTTESGTHLTTKEGYFVQGWPVDPATGLPGTTLGPMQFSRYGIMPQQPTTTVSLTGYLPADGSLTEVPLSFTAYVADSLPEEAAAQDAAIGEPAEDGQITVPALPSPSTVTHAYSLRFNAGTSNWELYDPSATLVQPLSMVGGSFQPISHGGYNFDFSDFYYFGTGTNGVAASVDGSPRGRLTSYATDRQGNVIEQFDNGLARTRYRLAAFNTVNEDTMRPIQDTYFAPSKTGTGVTTGAFVEAVQEGSQDPTNGFVPASLEGSNVDLADEMTKLIVAQRNYQAASKTITTSDEMTQTLVSIA